MPVTIRHLSPIHSEVDNNHSTVDIIGLYGVIDSIIEQAHSTLDLSENTKLGNLKKRLGYFAYTDPKLSLMGDAIEAWKKYRNQNSISLPISLEDEAILIFYIFIYHETSEVKIQNLRTILTQIGVNQIPNSLIQLCHQKPIERRLTPETGPFQKTSVSL